MIDYREIIRLKCSGYNNSNAAASCGSSRNTVAEVWALAREKGLEWPLPEPLTNEELERILYPHRQTNSLRKIPDFEYMHKELAKPGVTLTLLWSEYCEQCTQENRIPYQYTQFSDKYRAYAMSKKATMRIKRKPGELMEVDWAGDSICITDSFTGESIKAYLFIACLPCSMYSYAEAFPDMKSSHWIEAHIHAYQFFGGVTRILVPDNLKTGVTKNTRTELVLNRSYHEMAEYYGTAVIPARPASPKDKSSAEGTVRVIETWIIAALRNRKFFSFTELNQAITEKLQEFNHKPFQKRPGSRLTAFEQEEKAYLLPLPNAPYETSIWSVCTIQPDYLIFVNGSRYSVPHSYIGKKVEVRTSEKTVEIFYHDLRIASHIRKDYNPEPCYLLEHMPENHRKYLTYNAEYFKEWSAGVGSSVFTVVQHFLSMHKLEQQGYKNCVALMKLADRYSTERLEKACEKALSYTPSPSLKNIDTILKNGQDKVKTAKPAYEKQLPHGITRGAAYFRGGEQK